MPYYDALCHAMTTLAAGGFSPNPLSIAAFYGNWKGNAISETKWLEGVKDWLPTPEDRTYVKSLMKPVLEPGKFAGWIAPPAKGIDGKPVEFEYVKL